MKRRKYLTLTIVSALSVISGCSGNTQSGDSSEEDQQQTTDEEDQESDRDGDNQSVSGPEEVAKTFIQAIQEGDVETQEELLHEGSPSSPVEGGLDIEINLIEEKSIEQIAGNSRPNQEVEELESESEDLLNATDTTEYAWVLFKAENGEGQHLILVEDNGQWYVGKIA